MTIADLITILPVALHEALIEEEMNLNATMIETKGDLEEITTIIRLNVCKMDSQKMNTLSEIEDLIHVKSFMMSCSTFMGFEEAREIKRLSDFRFHYPSLYSTLEVFAWG